MRKMHKRLYFARGAYVAPMCLHPLIAGDEAWSRTTNVWQAVTCKTCLHIGKQLQQQGIPS